MAIKLSIEGTRDKVQKLMDIIKIQWRSYGGSKFATGRNEIRVDYYLDEHLYLKPTISVKQVSKLSIVGSKGSLVEIELLDASVTDMGNGITVIHGKSYDLFATPKGKS